MINFNEVIQKEINRISNNTENKRSLIRFQDFLKKNPSIEIEFSKVITETINGEWGKKEIVFELDKVLKENKLLEIEELDYLKINNAQRLSDLLVRNLKDTKLDNNRTIKTRSNGAKGGFYIFDDSKEERIEIPEPEIDELIEQEENIEAEDKRLEKDYYPAVRKWALKNGLENCSIIGNNRCKNKWENPDLIHVQGITYEILNSLDFEIVSFEVKLQVVPEAVWQAANYKLFSNYSYVAFAKNEMQIREKDEGSIFSLAQTHGIGILAWDQDRNEFKKILDPIKHTPPRENMEDALNDFSSVESINAIIKQSQKSHFSIIEKIIKNINQ